MYRWTLTQNTCNVGLMDCSTEYCRTCGL